MANTKKYNIDINKQLENGGEVGPGPKQKKKVYTDKKAYDKAYKVYSDSLKLYNLNKPMLDNWLDVDGLNSLSGETKFVDRGIIPVNKVIRPTFDAKDIGLNIKPKEYHRTEIVYKNPSKSNEKRLDANMDMINDVPVYYKPKIKPVFEKPYDISLSKVPGNNLVSTQPPKQIPDRYKKENGKLIPITDSDYNTLIQGKNVSVLQGTGKFLTDKQPIDTEEYMKNKKPLGGLLTAAQIALPLLQDKFSEITAAPVVPDTTYNSNPYGKMKYGGMIPSGFTQHDAPSHDNGGQAVDAQGKPNTVAPVAEIQNNENVFNNYVYSDMLTNPKTGKTFNIDMQKLAKKYKNADTDLLSKTALNISADNLAKTNDIVRSIVEAPINSTQMPTGGPLDPPWENFDYNSFYDFVGKNNLTNQGFKMDNNWGPQHDNLWKQYGDKYKIEQGYDHSKEYFKIPLYNGENPSNYKVKDWESGLLSLPWEAPDSNPDTYTKAPTYINKVMSHRFNSNAPVQASTLTDAPPNYSGVTSTDDKSGVQERGFNYNTAALVAKGLGLGDSAFRALRPAEVESPILPDYQSALDSMNRASIDLTSSRQNSMGISNILGNMNRSTSSGFGQYRNREAARIAGLQDNIADVTSQERTANSQLDMNRAGVKTNMANATAGALYQNRVDNQQNAAARDAFGSQFASELTQIGSSLNQYSNFQTELANRKDIATLNAQQVVAAAKAKGIDFDLGTAQEFLDAVRSGNSPVKMTTR